MTHPSLADTRPAVFWSDREDAPSPAPPLREATAADLVIIGGGFTGLWAAVQALEAEPGLRVAIVEAHEVGFGASSRNGGFCDPSLTHGVDNGVSHWPGEMGVLTRLGTENLAAIDASIARYGIDADFRYAPEMAVATEQWQVDELGEAIDNARAVGQTAELLDARQAQARVASPTYVGAMYLPSVLALVDPARLAWGLRSAAESLGATVYDHSPVTDISVDGSKGAGAELLVTTDSGASLRAPKVILATNAYPSPVRRVRRYVIPVYDHVLMTEPLSDLQLAAVGWAGGDGIGDAANQFHYYRMTADRRILWGGYDATYHFNNGLDPRHDQSPETHTKLAEHFFETFPQLAGLAFTHRWGGPIATTTQFTATWGTSFDGRLAWAAGYTGLGVAASRFGAAVALDLVNGRSTERTELSMVAKKPFPFPPEPLRTVGVALTKRSIQAADAHEGRRNLWLKTLDRFGIGFDS